MELTPRCGTRRTAQEFMLYEFALPRQVNSTSACTGGLLLGAATSSAELQLGQFTVTAGLT